MIVDSENKFAEFLTKWNSLDCYVEPVFADHTLHPCNNKIALLLVKFLNDDTFVLPFGHIDSDNLGLSKLKKLVESKTTKYTTKKKTLSHVVRLRNVIDLSVRKYLKESIAIDLSDSSTQAHDHIYREHFGMPNLNVSIPLLKHKELFDKYYESVKGYFVGDYNDFYNDTVIGVLSELETAGLAVDRNKFLGKIKNVSPDSLVYTEYNIYTSAGRPSNRHGGINFAALSKSDGSRRGFVSRFTDGSLIMYDYDAYHIRLIARIINMDLPNTSAHKWLAEQYFNGEVTEDKYEEAKAKTFKVLYGGVDEETINIPFFRKTDEFIQKLWGVAQEKGYVPSPSSSRRIYLKNIEDPTPQKLFNYLLQLFETEENIKKMGEIQDYLRDKKSKLILYTYDSFLLDVHPDEKEVVAREVKKILQSTKIPVHSYEGSNYHTLTNIDV